MSTSSWHIFGFNEVVETGGCFLVNESCHVINHWMKSPRPVYFRSLYVGCAGQSHRRTNYENFISSPGGEPFSFWAIFSLLFLFLNTRFSNHQACTSKLTKKKKKCSLHVHASSLPLANISSIRLHRRWKLPRGRKRQSFKGDLQNAKNYMTTLLKITDYPGQELWNF